MNGFNPGASFIGGDTISSFFLDGVRILLLVAALLYILFAIMVTRQISLMRATIATDFSPVLRLIGIFHLIFAVAVFLLFIAIL